MRRLFFLLIFPVILAHAAHAQPLLDLAQARWRVRDVAKNTPFTDDPAELEKLQLRLVAPPSAGSGLFRSRYVVEDTSGQDRAVTLAFCVPVRNVTTWHDDPQVWRAVEPGKTYSNLTETRVGVEAQASLYPLAVVSGSDGRGAALCVPLTPPRLVRFVLDTKRNELRAEFDFGLSKDSKAFPSHADAEVLAFEVPAKWAFRHAVRQYWDLFPAAFERRVKDGGTWLPFGYTHEIENPEDFRIRFHEAGGPVSGDAGKAMAANDAKIGAMTFPYVEPMTYWQQYRGDAKAAGYEPRFKQVEEDAAKGDEGARSVLTSGVRKADGKLDLYLEPVAYTPMAPWGLNADPNIAADESRGYLSRGAYALRQLESLLGLGSEPAIGHDGVYIDSIEGWSGLIDHDRTHWRVSPHPLTFDPWSKKVGLMNLWGTYAFTEQLSRTLRGHDLLLFVNDAFHRYWVFAPFIDVPGREYAWQKEGKFSPVPDERYLFFKSMSGRKPYLMLMNNEYDDASIFEPYFQRSLFYAVWPSMFMGHTKMGETAYFSNPAWYNRDRPLFRKYLPLIDRLDRAGWQPVPYAEADGKTRVERYGEFAAGTLAFTLHNTTDAIRTVTLRLSRTDLHLPPTVRAAERIAGKSLTPESEADSISLTLDLPPQGYAAIGVTKD